MFCARANVRICRDPLVPRSGEDRLLPMPEHLRPRRLVNSYRNIDSAPFLVPDCDRDTGFNTSNCADFDPVYRICAEAPQPTMSPPPSGRAKGAAWFTSLWDRYRVP